MNRIIGMSLSGDSSPQGTSIVLVVWRHSKGPPSGKVKAEISSAAPLSEGAMLYAGSLMLADVFSSQVEN